jgi:hypothetical protein
VTFGAPNKVTVTIGGKLLTGRLVVSNGALQAVFAGITPSTLPLINAGNGNPIHFTSVAVASSTVTLVGTMDLQTILGL